MVVQRTQRDDRSGTDRHGKGREGILSTIVQIVTFFGLCYLLIVFHYELVQSKAEKRAMASQIAALETRLENLKYLEEEARKRAQSKTVVHTNKPVDLFRQRKKRNTNQVRPAVIHMVAVTEQPMALDGSAYLSLKHDQHCSPVCHRTDDFVVPDEPSYIQVGTTGYYQVYAQVKCGIKNMRGLNHSFHSVEIEYNGSQQEHFTSGGDINSSHYTGGVICIEAGSRVRVKVWFETCRLRTCKNIIRVNCEENGTFLGLVRVGNATDRC